MRSLVLALTLTLAASAQAAEITRVWTGWQKAEAFERLGEFFPGLNRSKESPLLLTHPKSRDGYYLSVRLQNEEARPGASIEVSVISPASPKPQVHRFSADLPAGTRTYNIGITGSDWPGPDAAAVAWLVTIRTADGKTLASKQSFLWK